MTVFAVLCSIQFFTVPVLNRPRPLLLLRNHSNEKPHIRAAFLLQIGPKRDLSPGQFRASHHFAGYIICSAFFLIGHVDRLSRYTPVHLHRPWC